MQTIALYLLVGLIVYVEYQRRGLFAKQVNNLNKMQKKLKIADESAKHMKYDPYVVAFIWPVILITDLFIYAAKRFGSNDDAAGILIVIGKALSLCIKILKLPLLLILKLTRSARGSLEKEEKQ